MRALLQMVLANVRMSYRNRMALFWNLAFPALFIVIFGFFFSGGFDSVNVGVAGAETNEVSQQITQGLEGAEGFSVSQGTKEEQLEALRDGDRSVVVVFSPAEGSSKLDATIYYDESDPTTSAIGRNAVQSFLDQVNISQLGDQRLVAVDAEPVTSTELDYLDFLVPGILAMSIMNSGLIGLASAFVTYREKGILRRIKATPFPLWQFITARIISQLLISVAQAAVLLALARLIFDLRWEGNLFAIFVMVIVGAIAFLSIGFVISSFAKNQEAADAISNAIAFPMLFLAGVFFPLDMAPDWLQPIAALLPLKYFADGLRNIMAHGSTLPGEWLNILILFITAVIGLLLSVRFFKWESRTV